MSLHNTQVNVPNWISGNVNGQLSLTRSGPTPVRRRDGRNFKRDDPVFGYRRTGARRCGRRRRNRRKRQACLPCGRVTRSFTAEVCGVHSATRSPPSVGQRQPQPDFRLPSVDMNVGLNANNNVRIRGGSSIDLTTTGGIVIAGNLQAPTLSGQFQAIRGQVGYFDTTFRLISGTVTFDPTSGLLPTLNATAVTNVSGAQITLTVSGRVDNLNTDLESNPSMSRDEIIATLLHAPSRSRTDEFHAESSASDARRDSAELLQRAADAQFALSGRVGARFGIKHRVGFAHLQPIWRARARVAHEVHAVGLSRVSIVVQRAGDHSVRRVVSVARLSRARRLTDISTGLCPVHHRLQSSLHIPLSAADLRAGIACEASEQNVPFPGHMMQPNCSLGRGFPDRGT